MKELVVVLIAVGIGISLGGCVSITPTLPPTPTVLKTSTPVPNPTLRVGITATVTPAVNLENEIYVQFSGAASHRMGSSRRENFYDTSSIPLEGYHLKGGFLCYIFERTPDGPEYNGWPGWALYFSRERSNGNVSSAALDYDQRNDGRRDCVAIGHGHGDDRPDRISTVPRYRNFSGCKGRKALGN